jgi:hypothetical protein
MPRVRSSARIALALTVLLLFPDGMLAQTCHGSLGGALVGHVGTTCHGGGCPDNYVHVRVQINAGGNIYNAAKAALDQWNAYANVTKTKFDYDELSATFPHVTIGAAGDSWGCGGYGGDQIGYKQSEMEAVTNNNSAHATYIFAHELGHFLGLAEAYAQSGTVMNSMIGQPGQSCLQVMQSNPPATLSVQSNDADKAAECSATARAGTGFGAPPPEQYTHHIGDGTYCEEYYLLEHYYYCSASGCYYGFTLSTYLGTWCPN